MGLNSKKFSNALFEPMEKDGLCNTKSKVTDKLKCISETVHSIGRAIRFPWPYLLSKRLEKAVTKNSDDPKKSDKRTIPEDFLCPISLELMKDPTIVSTGQTYERSYIQRWIDLWKSEMPKDPAETQKLHSYSHDSLDLLTHLCIDLLIL